jgi:hypothetical protein
VGQEWVTFPNGREVKYGQGGLGFGGPTPGFGGGYSWGYGWNIEKPSDYNGFFWELQFGVFPLQFSLSGSGLLFSHNATTIKGGLYFGTPGVNLFFEEYGYEPR